MYTAPAYFMSLIVAITLFLLSKYFKDRSRSQSPKDIKKKSAKRAAINDQANLMTMLGFTIYDCCILGCMLLNISTKGSIGSFETMGVSMAMSHFDMTSSQAGTVVASCGTIGVISLLSMGRFSQYLSDIQLISSGMIVMASGILSLTVLDEDNANPSWRFVLAIFMIYSVGYPIGHTAVIGLFSKSESFELLVLCIIAKLSLLICFLQSCGKKTAGNTAGLVCLCRIIG
jgi:ceroid-lipofuscinosis MFS transporter 7